MEQMYDNGSTLSNTEFSTDTVNKNGSINGSIKGHTIRNDHDIGNHKSHRRRTEKYSISREEKCNHKTGLQALLENDNKRDDVMKSKRRRSEDKDHHIQYSSEAEKSIGTVSQHLLSMKKSEKYLKVCFPLIVYCNGCKGTVCMDESLGEGRTMGWRNVVCGVEWMSDKQLSSLVVALTSSMQTDLGYDTL
jgi:hypothetical protein